MLRRCYLLPCLMLAVSGGLQGCPSTQLGQCVPADAELLVFDRDGNPAFAGQAIVEQLCISCHNVDAVGPVRRGAPAGFDFAMIGIRDVASDGGPVRAGEENEDQLAVLAALRASRNVIFEHRFGMFDTVAEGTMPPGDIGGGAFVQQAYSFFDTEMPLPELTSSAGVEIYRNWLACNAPIVERTGNGDRDAQGQRCDESAGVGACVIRRDPNIEPIDPQWSSIKEEVFGPSGCLTLTCHSGSGPAAGLSLEGSPASVVGIGPSSSDMCFAETLPLVSADGSSSGDAAGSLLFEKLARGPGASGCDAYIAPTTRCGTSMPVGRFVGCAALRAIRDWIEAGAQDN